MLGIPAEEMAIDWNTVVFNMLTIKGIYGREMYETWYKMTVMLQSGLDIAPVITHRFRSTSSRKASRSCAPASRARSSWIGKRFMICTERFEGTSDRATRRHPRGGAVQERARHHDAAGRAHPGRRRRAGARTSAPTTIWAWPITRTCSRRRTRRWTAGATAWRRVRFICGTQERPQATGSSASATSSGTEDTILYGSCFDANGGLFETLLGAEDAVISDELNHASIIDGVRLCKAQRFRYKNSDMADLEAQAARRPQTPATPADRHRRRLLHGRLHRQPARDLRSRRALRRAGDGG